ncbi:MAG: mechanosensitive ion channel [Arachnia sp.]
MGGEEVALDVLAIAGWAGLGLVFGALASIVLSVSGWAIVRRHPRMRGLTKRMRAPQRVFCLVLGIGLTVYAATSPAVGSSEPTWRQVFLHTFIIVLILAGAYVLTGAVRTVEDAVVHRPNPDEEETAHYRRVRTQMQIVTRVLIVVVWVCALAGVLLTFQGFRAVGASLFASAGVLSLVAGLAAQSSLANVFAGMQIVFSDALRVGDLIVFNQQSGSVEEITLTYVVVRTWDGRRWIVPSNHFTTQPFENWTRREPQLLGDVLFDFDWLIPVEAMRVELIRLVSSSDLWDGRSASLQVTDAVGGHVRIRAVVSAATSGDLWDLRCFVREELIGWVQREAVYALPRMRVEPETTTAPPVEERENYVERVVEEYEREQQAEETRLMEATATVEDTGEEPALPRWLQSWIDNRRQPKADDAESPVETTLSSRSPEARLYSGSPEADERNRQLSGPGAAALAEREQAAERRLGTTGEQPKVKG